LTADRPPNEARGGGTDRGRSRLAAANAPSSRSRGFFPPPGAAFPAHPYMRITPVMTRFERRPEGRGGSAVFRAPQARGEENAIMAAQLSLGVVGAHLR
jgi:hypothetical protein